MAVSQSTGSKFLLRGWERGIEKHSSVIFVRKKSPIEKLSDLKGKRIALEDPLSTTGYFLPKVFMIQKGLRLVPKKSHLDSVLSDEVGYLFSQEDGNTLLWVRKGKVDSGAVDYENYKREKGFNEDFKILAQTSSLPSLMVSARPDLPPFLSDKVKSILKTMDSSEEGRKILKDLHGTIKFDEIPPQALTPLLKSLDFIHLELKQ